MIALVVSLALFLVPIAVTGPVFSALALVNGLVTVLVFLALTVANWSLNARAFFRLKKQTMEATSAISITALTLTPIAIFLVFPVESKMIKIYGIFQRGCSLGRGTVKLKGRLNGVTNSGNHKIT